MMTAPGLHSSAIYPIFPTPVQSATFQTDIKETPVALTTSTSPAGQCWLKMFKCFTIANFPALLIYMFILQEKMSLLAEMVVFCIK